MDLYGFVLGIVLETPHFLYFLHLSRLVQVEWAA
jgi:hypothetical protein